MTVHSFSTQCKTTKQLW